MIKGKTIGIQKTQVFLKKVLISISGYILCLLTFGCTYDDVPYEINRERGIEKRGEWLHYIVTEYNNGIYKDTIQSIRMIPKQSALVLIDVWRDEFLDQFVIDHVNPLIEEFSAKGVKIIYAPSQMPENENLLDINEGIHFYDFETMDSYLQENNIENLFYAGFDTFYCVLDKPNGIYNLKMRNDSFHIFLLERGVLSYTKEMMEASIELLKKNGVGIIPYEGDDKIYPQQTITDINAKTKSNAPPKKNSFIILFQNNDNDEALENFKKELDRLEMDYGIVETDNLTFRGEEVAPENLTKFFRDRKIWNLYYAGNYLNNEIIWSKFGVLPLYIKDRYQLVRGLPQPFIITDLAYMAPSPSMEAELEKVTILNHYRMIYNINSTTLLNSWEEKS